MQLRPILINILLFSFIFLSKGLFAQVSWQIQGNSLTTLKNLKVDLPNSFAKSVIPLNKKGNPEIPSLKTAIINPLQTGNQPKGWSYQELGLFCKLEVKMEKAFKMPVKFRLGEVQYVEKMEGKKGYVLPPPIER